MALEDIFMPVFTDAGRAAVAAADGAGLDVTIAEIAFGDAQYAVRDVDGNALTAAVQMTTLTNELLRVSCSAGSAVDDYSILVEAVAAAGAPTFWIGEVGFFLDDGTLLAVASHDTQYIGWRGDIADWVFRFVLSWTDLPASAITVQFNGDAAYSALSVDHERLEAKVRHTVESEGLTWSDPDDTLLTAAVNAKVAGVDLSTKADLDLGNTSLAEVANAGKILGITDLGAVGAVLAGKVVGWAAAEITGGSTSTSGSTWVSTLVSITYTPKSSASTIIAIANALLRAHRAYGTEADGLARNYTRLARGGAALSGAAGGSNAVQPEIIARTNSSGDLTLTAPATIVGWEPSPGADAPYTWEAEVKSDGSSTATVVADAANPAGILILEVED